MKKIKAFYKKYQSYIRVDLVMYGVMILLILLYFMYTLLYP
jgi:hypothetical protein